MSTNLYKRLKALLPDDPVMTGQISAVYADGTALVALEGAAGLLRVRNPLGKANSSRVYVQGGEVTGAAPEMAYVLIEV
ncbi:hypothetical protein QYQ99_03580 [Comamonas testosteroni]|uniref:hypothetical protein n=1 Tax=Comamonas testosteroni TaxID=285 RepID=UPI00265F4DD3|nr:hypothetical protein [Comamonas testosteroni]WKL16648.1 hypothetical protein QYQ99_03580 [Comamonas testosteroni]